MAGVWKVIEGKLRRKQSRGLWVLSVTLMTIGLLLWELVQWAQKRVGEMVK